MEKCLLLDASAIIAAIQNENGSDFVKERIEQCAISTVNWAEVLQKLSARGIDTVLVEQNLKAMGLIIIDFNQTDARLAADLWPQAKSFGLSLADRACLATGLRLNAQVVTADRIWQKLDLKLEIVLIR